MKRASWTSRLRRSTSEVAFANGITGEIKMSWNGGHFYAAVLVFLPVQFAYVVFGNLSAWFTMVIGNSMVKSSHLKWEWE